MALWWRALFAWETVRSDAFDEYQQNSITGKRRRIIKMVGGYRPHVPIQQEWLDGGCWRDPPVRVVTPVRPDYVRMG